MLRRTLFISSHESYVSSPASTVVTAMFLLVTRMLVKCFIYSTVAKTVLWLSFPLLFTAIGSYVVEPVFLIKILLEVDRVVIAL